MNIAPIAFRGSVDGSSSYFFHLENVARWFSQRDFFVTIRPTTLNTKGVDQDTAKLVVNQPQPLNKEVIIHDPSHDPVGSSDLEACFITMWESTTLPPDYVKNLNRAKVVVVPTQWQASVFAAQGVVVPIRVVPMGVDSARFPFRYTERRAGKFVFGAAGNLAGGGCRKNLQAVVDAYRLLRGQREQHLAAVKAWEEGSSTAQVVSRRPSNVLESWDLELLIKTYPGNELPKDLGASVKIVQELFSPEKLPKLYRQMNCFVSASRGEGWGLMQHEAMLSGVPVIGCPFGGLSSFLDEATGYPVDYTLKSADDRYEGCGQWADVRPSALARRMLEVLSHQDTYSKVTRARKRVERLTWDHSNELLAEVLLEFGFIDHDSILNIRPR